jgi:hypothetical protein
MLKGLNVDIRIDERGEGNVITESINGYIKIIALPKSILYNTRVKIRPQDMPDLVVQISMKEGEMVYRLKMPTSDILGNKTPEMADIPVKGNLEVGVGGAIPDSVFRLNILYDTDG